MVLKTTRIAFDTCDCAVDYTWDTDDPEDTRQHTFKRFENKCSVHQGQPGSDEDHYNVVAEENRRKNYGLGHILDNGPPGLYDEETNIDDDGNPQTARRLKRGVNYTWTWSGTPPNRILIVSFTGPGASMTPQQKNGLTNALNARFGSNKIVLA